MATQRIDKSKPGTELKLPELNVLKSKFSLFGSLKTSSSVPTINFRFDPSARPLGIPEQRKSIGRSQLELLRESPNPDLDESLVKIFEDEEKEDKQEIMQYEGEEFEKALIGPTGYRKFHNIYKRGRRIEALQQQYRRKPTAAQIYLMNMDKMKMVPKTLGMVKQFGKKSEISIPSFSMGDSYALALSEGMMHLTQIEKLDVSNNRLSNKGAKKILLSVPEKLKKLNLSQNYITSPTYKSVGDLLGLRNCELKELNLENNRAGDSGAELIAKALDDNYCKCQ